MTSPPVTGISSGSQQSTSTAVEAARNQPPLSLSPKVFLLLYILTISAEERTYCNLQIIYVRLLVLLPNYSNFIKFCSDILDSKSKSELVKARVHFDFNCRIKKAYCISAGWQYFTIIHQVPARNADSEIKRTSRGRGVTFSECFSRQFYCNTFNIFACAFLKSGK